MNREKLGEALNMLKTIYNSKQSRINKLENEKKDFEKYIKILEPKYQKIDELEKDIRDERKLNWGIIGFNIFCTVLTISTYFLSIIPGFVPIICCASLIISCANQIIFEKDAEKDLNKQKEFNKIYENGIKELYNVNNKLKVLNYEQKKLMDRIEKISDVAFDHSLPEDYEFGNILVDTDEREDYTIIIPEYEK